MEGAPLRPLPRRPSEPLEPGAALREVSARLPALDQAAARALALVELAGRRRDSVAVELELSAAQVGDALARGRKALRRALYPLPGSGWCERAERMLSDRIDDALDPPGPARLDAHLRNCPRCVEHERWLVAALDRLVEEATAAPPEESIPSPPPDLQVVPPAEEAVEDQPEPHEPDSRHLRSLWWGVLLVLAVVLALAALVVTALGITHVV